MKKYSKTTYNTIPLFQNISEGDWKDWKWQREAERRHGKRLDQDSQPLIPWQVKTRTRLSFSAGFFYV